MYGHLYVNQRIFKACKEGSRYRINSYCTTCGINGLFVGGHENVINGNRSDYRDHDYYHGNHYGMEIEWPKYTDTPNTYETRWNRTPKQPSDILTVIFADKLFRCPICGRLEIEYPDEESALLDITWDVYDHSLYLHDKGVGDILDENYDRWIKGGSGYKNVQYRRCESCKEEKLTRLSSAMRERFPLHTPCFYEKDPIVYSDIERIKWLNARYGPEYGRMVADALGIGKKVSKRSAIVKAAAIRKLKRIKRRITNHEVEFFKMLLGVSKVRSIFENTNSGHTLLKYS